MPIGVGFVQAVPSLARGDSRESVTASNRSYHAMNQSPSNFFHLDTETVERAAAQPTQFVGVPPDRSAHQVWNDPGPTRGRA